MGAEHRVERERRILSRKKRWILDWGWRLDTHGDTLAGLLGSGNPTESTILEIVRP